MLDMDNDFEAAKNHQEALQPIRLASEVLGRRDAILLTTEGSVSFLYSKLTKSNSNVGNDLFHAIMKRINNPRQKEIITELKFLQGLPRPSLFDEIIKNICFLKSYFQRTNSN